MTEEMKAAREKRKAFLFDYMIAVLVTAIALQVTIPALIPLVQAFKGSSTEVVAASKVPSK